MPKLDPMKRAGMEDVGCEAHTLRSTAVAVTWATGHQSGVREESEPRRPGAGTVYMHWYVLRCVYKHMRKYLNA
jgi:hypothetical protein